MATTLAVCAALLMVGAACSADSVSDPAERGDGTADTMAGDTTADTAAHTMAGEPVTEAAPPELPEDFSWTGRYLVPDLGVEVPFSWSGSGGDFQMIAGGADEVIHFTNVLHDGELYTLTYEWPDVPRNPCSHVGAFSVAEFNEGLATASYVGHETLHDDEPGGRDWPVHHYRSTAVLDLPAGLIPELEGIDLRLPLMAGDIYVDADDNTVFRRVLHFGLQNLYDPDLDEWIFIDDARPDAGEVSLPEECVLSEQ